jgi:hypothetical protein
MKMITLYILTGLILFSPLPKSHSPCVYDFKIHMRYTSPFSCWNLILDDVLKYQTSIEFCYADLQLIKINNC